MFSFAVISNILKLCFSSCVADTWGADYIYIYPSPIYIKSNISGASLVAQLIKNLPVMQETLVGFLGWEDTLEKR